MRSVNDKVGTVIVTYNRKFSLINCLEKVINQTYLPDVVYVIDNFSTDGSPELLKEKGYIDDIPVVDNQPVEVVKKIKIQDRELEIRYVRMNENTGGAGGFYEGIKRSYEAGCDWIWLMDDDGFPSPNCLENLMKHKDKGDFLNAVVVSTEDSKRLAFSCRELFIWNKRYIRSENRIIDTLEDLKRESKNGIFYDAAIPFNGTLISRKLVSRIGFPIKEFFTWYDEVEYMYRAILAGFKLLVILDAVFYHPPEKKVIRRLFNRYPVIDDATDLRRYCIHRNETHMLLKYNRRALVKNLIKYAFFYLFYKPRYLGLYMEAVLDGILGRWGKEKKFIKQSLLNDKK